MATRKKKTPLPSVGAAFAFKLEDGRYSMCRVLLDETSQQAKEMAPNSVLVACSAWVGESIPEAENPELRPILHLTHHSWKNEPELWWVSDPVPAEFIPLGIIPPTREEQELARPTYGYWSSLTFQPLLQWRWDHEREAVLAEDVIEKQKEHERWEQRAQARAKYLAEVTLEALLEHRFFPGWKRYPSKKATAASRTIMLETVQQLLTLGSEATESQKLAVLQHCIESFNAIDAKLNHFIETEERENICAEFDAIVHACGLGHYDCLADTWREW
ncbi:MAG: hypothetical protein K1Y36_24185 [Blastocatellia bacterium]|nr:hypothetical protein [Blastocatellia bacterium]